MAGWRTISFAVLSATLLLTVAAQCPPDNPFCNIWVPCNYTQIQGPYCQDCSTRVICTAIGGLVRPCWFPGKRHCVDGQCVSQPSDECSPATPTTPLPPTEESTTTEGTTLGTTVASTI